MALGIGLLAILAVLLALALILSTAKVYLTRWLFKRKLPWKTVFGITLGVGAVYAAASTALGLVLAGYATFLTSPSGLLLHAILVQRFVPDANGHPLPLREAILGQALTLFFFAAQHSPIIFHLLRGSS